MSELLEMIPLHDYQRQRAQVFPSLDSLRWFIRHNHAELGARGALLMPARRLLVVPGRFDEFVQDIGAKKLRRAAGTSC